MRVRLGWLTVAASQIHPTVASVTVSAAEATCHMYHRYGWSYGTVGSGRMDCVTCWVCGGSGVEPNTTVAA